MSDSRPNQSKPTVNRRTIGADVVEQKTDLSRSTLYRMEKADRFPKRRQLSPGRIGWLEEEIDQWLEQRERGFGRPVKAAGGAV